MTSLGDSQNHILTARVCLRRFCSHSVFFLWAPTVVCTYCDVTLGLVSPCHLCWRFEVLGLREKIVWIHCTPFCLLHESCNMRGTGFAHSNEGGCYFIASSFCEVQTYSLNHAAHVKPPPSCGFQELQCVCLRAERRMVDGSSTHPVVMRELPVGLFESCEFSSIAFERLEPGYAWELIQYEGNQFVLIATKLNSSPFSG